MRIKASYIHPVDFGGNNCYWILLQSMG